MWPERTPSTRTDSPYCRRVGLGTAVGAHVSLCRSHRIPYMHFGLHTIAPIIISAATIWPRCSLHAQTALTAGVPRHRVESAACTHHATTTASRPTAFLAYTEAAEPFESAVDAEEVFSCHGPRRGEAQWGVRA